MFALPILLLLGADEPGFGGAAPSAPASSAPGVAADEGTADDADVDPEQAALRARLDAALKLEGGSRPRAEAPARRTKLEGELDRAGLDARLPLLAFRIEVARAELLHDELKGTRQRPEVLQASEDKLAAIHAMSDLVERVALARLVKCSRSIGAEVKVKNYRMTPGGPVMLSTAEVLDQVPLGDPEGCERIVLMDAPTLDKVRHLFAIRAELKTRNFGFHEVAARRALEAEERALAHDLEQQALFSTPLSPLR